MPVANNIIVGFDGTHAQAGALSGWARYTTGDGYYFRGAATASEVTGGVQGAANHLHTIVDHNHTWNHTTHNFSHSGSSSSYDAGIGRLRLSSNLHTHAATASNTKSAGAQNATGLSTPASTDNHPPYTEIIWIQADGNNDVPDKGIVWTASDTFATNWTRFGGNTFLKGAAAAGDAGGTGGATNHTHPAGTSHLHALDHSHASKNSASAVTNISTGGAYGAFAATRHTHNVTLSTNTFNSSSTNIPITSSVDFQPPYEKLNAVKNGNGSDSSFDQMIAIWTGTIANIPTDWARYTNTDADFVKCCNADAEVGDTGGTLQHGHTTTGHTHTQSHTHTASDGGASALAGQDTPGQPLRGARNNHVHLWTVTTDTTALSSATVTINNNTSGAALPQHLEGIWIQWTEPVSFKPQVMIF